MGNHKRRWTPTKWPLWSKLKHLHFSRDKEKLGQKKSYQVVKGLETMSYEEWLKELGMISLQKRRQCMAIFYSRGQSYSPLKQEQERGQHVDIEKGIHAEY